MTKEKDITEEVFDGPMVYGNGLTHIIRVCFDKKDVIGAMGILPYHSCQLVRGVGEKHLDIEGNDKEGFTFVAKDEEGEHILDREDKYNGV